MNQDPKKRKEGFLSIAVHELRAPMTAIKGYLSMMYEGDGGEIPPKAKKYLQSAIDGNARLLRLVGNMLNIVKIEEGKMIFDLGVIELGEIVKVSYEEFRASADLKNITYSLDIPPDIRDQVEIDTQHMREVLANLISNAIKYTQEGQVFVRLFNPNPKAVRVEIVDTGLGVASTDQADLFQKFSKTRISQKKAVGPGIGLYASKLIIEKFGGTIGVESEKDRGATFWFELPKVLQ